MQILQLNRRLKASEELQNPNPTKMESKNKVAELQHDNCIEPSRKIEES